MWIRWIRIWIRIRIRKTGSRCKYSLSSQYPGAAVVQRAVESLGSPTERQGQGDTTVFSGQSFAILDTNMNLISWCVDRSWLSKGDRNQGYADPVQVDNAFSVQDQLWSQQRDKGEGDTTILVGSLLPTQTQI